MSIDSTIRNIVKKELEENNTAGRFKLELTSKLLPHPNSISHSSLPFPPFIGLTLNVSGAILTITYVFWNHKRNVFEVKADS